MDLLPGQRVLLRRGSSRYITQQAAVSERIKGRTNKEGFLVLSLESFA